MEAEMAEIINPELGNHPLNSMKICHQTRK